MASCKRSLSEEKMVKYINNPKHGLIQENLINGTQLKLIYRPSDLLAWQEIQATDSVSRDKVKEIRARYNGQYYFLLSISPQGREILSFASDREWFSAMVSKLSFGMEECINLVNETRDTLKLLTYNYPRMYGMSSSTDMLFVFEKMKLKSNDMLTFEMKEFGLLTGDVKFKIMVRDLKRAPKLKELNKQD
jgi:hypothetical protein